MKRAVRGKKTRKTRFPSSHLFLLPLICNGTADGASCLFKMKLLAKFQGPSHQGEIRGGPCGEERKKEKNQEELRKRKKRAACTDVKSGACGEHMRGKFTGSGFLVCHRGPSSSEKKRKKRKK